MKKTLLFAVLAGVMAICISSCKKEPQDGPKETYTIEFRQDMNVALVGTAVKFTDLSLGATSRTWKFQDGTPATSTDAEVSVVFGSFGQKNCSLEVTFPDKSTQKKEFTIQVNEELSAAIAVSGLSPKGCAKKGTEITFSLEDIKGGADAYEWTFPGGTPATSTEASPKVVWNSQINDVEVTCVVKRTTDNSTITVTKNIIAGNYPLFTVDDAFGKDMYSFDKYDALGSAHIWGDCGSGAVERNDCNTNPGLFTYVTPGANGTAKGLKINLPSISVEQVFEKNYEFNFRDNWSNNAVVTIGDKLELKMSLKVADPTTMASIFWGKLSYQLDSWNWDNSRGIKPEDSWAEIFPEFDYETCISYGHIDLGEFSIISEEHPDAIFTTEWQEYTWVFDTGEGPFAAYKGIVLPNTYITFGLVATGAVCIDEIQLNVIED